MLLTTLCLLAAGQVVASAAPSNTAPSTTETPVKVAVPGLKLHGLDEKLADFYSGHLAQQLSFQGVSTITSTEMAALLGLERQRQLLGCSDDSCRADIASALGVDGVLVGTVTKLEKSYLLDVRILASGTGTPLAAASSNSDDNDRLVGTFTVVASELARQLSQKLHRDIAAKPGMELVSAPSSVKRLSWVPLAVGVAAAVAGGVMLGLSRSSYGDLTTPRPNQPPFTMSETDAIAAKGATYQTVGWVGLGVGAAGLVGAALMFFLGGNETVTAGVALSPNAFHFGVSGVWP